LRCTGCEIFKKASRHRGIKASSRGRQEKEKTSADYADYADFFKRIFKRKAKRKIYKDITDGHGSVRKGKK